MNRTDVFEVIDSERTYQDKRWGSHKHTPTEWLVYIRDYTEEALHWLSREDDDAALKEKVMSNIRKITALGVAAIEEHGAFMRSQL